MMFEDNISCVGTIDAASKFNIPNKVFYVFAAPKGEASVNIISLNARPCYNEEDVVCPITVGAWSPIVFSSVTPTSEQISAYTFYWGTEG